MGLEIGCSTTTPAASSDPPLLCTALLDKNAADNRIFRIGSPSRELDRSLQMDAGHNTMMLSYGGNIANYGGLSSVSANGHTHSIPATNNMPGESSLVGYEQQANASSSSSYASENGFHGKGGEWQSWFAAINGQVATQIVKDEAKSLDMVPVPVEEEESKIVVNLPRALSISDLSPAPMHGSTLRVAYQGVPGAYSEAAAAKAYPQCEPVPCEQFEAAFQAVELWLADRAVLPVENSLGGSIHRNYDLLLRHRLHIVGEVQLPVHHCLLVMPGVKKEELRRVISHPQALAQCEQTLTRLGLDVAREAVDDTAGAAQFIAENGLRDTAAIASSRAAEIYGLQVIADGIQDDPGNVTRFVMLAREPIIPRTDRPFKTSIVFANEEATGALFKVLSAFAFRKINLTKIESRPQRKRPMRVVDNTNRGTAKYFEYLFYIDFEASMADPRAQNAMNTLQEFTTFLRVLGSYPMDMTPLVRSPPL